MKRRIKFVEQSQKANEIRVTTIQSENNRADILTKILSVATFKRLRDVIFNVRNAAVRLHQLVRGKTMAIS